MSFPSNQSNISYLWMTANLYIFSWLKSYVLLLFSFAPPAPYVSPSFSLYGDAAWRERLTPRPLMSFLDTQDLLTNSSSSSAPSGDLGVGGSSKGGGAKGHGWSKMMHVRVLMEMGCLWPFLGHSVYTLGLWQRWWCILEGLVMNRWCWLWWNDNKMLIIWYSLARCCGSAFAQDGGAKLHRKFLTHCHLGAVTNQPLLRHFPMKCVCSESPSPSKIFQTSCRWSPVYSASWGCFMEASWQASWHWPQRCQGFVSNL